MDTVKPSIKIEDIIKGWNMWMLQAFTPHSIDNVKDSELNKDYRELN